MTETKHEVSKSTISFSDSEKAEIRSWPPHIQEQLNRYLERPKMTLTKKADGQLVLHPSHSSTNRMECLRQMAECYGSSDSAFTEALLNQTTNVLAGGKVNEGAVNQSLAFMRGISPRDEIDGMLAAQMTACHTLAMEMMRRANQDDKSSEVITQTVGRATKLMGAFVKLLDSLQGYRGQSPARTVVQKVNVHDGGQAVVGNVLKS